MESLDGAMVSSVAVLGKDFYSRIMAAIQKHVSDGCSSEVKKLEHQLLIVRLCYDNEFGDGHFVRPWARENRHSGILGGFGFSGHLLEEVKKLPEPYRGICLINSNRFNGISKAGRQENLREAIYDLKKKLEDVKKQEQSYVSSFGCNGLNKPINDLQAFYNFLLEVKGLSYSDISRLIGLFIKFNSNWAKSHSKHNIKNIDTIMRLAEFYTVNGSVMLTDSHISFNFGNGNLTLEELKDNGGILLSDERILKEDELISLLSQLFSKFDLCGDEDARRCYTLNVTTAISNGVSDKQKVISLAKDEFLSLGRERVLNNIAPCSTSAANDNEFLSELLRCCAPDTYVVRRLPDCPLDEFIEKLNACDKILVDDKEYIIEQMKKLQASKDILESLSDDKKKLYLEACNLLERATGDSFVFLREYLTKYDTYVELYASGEISLEGVLLEIDSVLAELAVACELSNDDGKGTGIRSAIGYLIDCIKERISIIGLDALEKEDWVEVIESVRNISERDQVYGGIYSALYALYSYLDNSITANGDICDDDVITQIKDTVEYISNALKRNGKSVSIDDDCSVGNRFIFLLDNRGEAFALKDMDDLQMNVKADVRALISRITPENVKNFTPVLGRHPNQNRFHEVLSATGHVAFVTLDAARGIYLIVGVGANGIKYDEFNNRFRQWYDVICEYTKTGLIDELLKEHASYYDLFMGDKARGSGDLKKVKQHDGT